MPKDDTSNLTQLGSANTSYENGSPRTELLETFPNQFPDRQYVIKHAFREFTSLCPKTGQPDFATIHINYIARERCVESKSLKLYFFAWRNQGTFMETIVNTILEHLVAVTSPRWMIVSAEFAARGGIVTAVEAEYYEPSEDDLTEQTVQTFDTLTPAEMS